MYELDLLKWKPDGQGTVERVGDTEYEAHVQTPLTLWCPTPAAGDVEIEFDCQVTVANSAMLLFLCARNWRGPALLETTRQGEYPDYSSRDMACYTIGFNRAAHVTTDVQPNASTANVRRLGGPDALEFAGVSLRDRSAEAMARWHRWDTHSLLCSVREHASGLGRYYHYCFRSAAPRLTMELEGEELFSVVDHRPDPLAGGCLGLRNMTPGGGYRVRNLVIRDVVPQAS